MSLISETVERDDQLAKSQVLFNFYAGNDLIFVYLFCWIRILYGCEEETKGRGRGYLIHSQVPNPRCQKKKA